MPKMKSTRKQWGDSTREALDEACRTLIDVARQNPNGDDCALLRAIDAETGELFEIAVRKAAKQG